VVETNRSSEMEYLLSAERYAELRGDLKEVQNLYDCFLSYNDGEEAVWKTLSYLYGNRVADMINA
jgi:hypothetical protein